MAKAPRPGRSPEAKGGSRKGPPEVFVYFKTSKKKMLPESRWRVCFGALIELRQNTILGSRGTLTPIKQDLHVRVT